jgi:hypothetical protein
MVYVVICFFLIMGYLLIWRGVKAIRRRSIYYKLWELKGASAVMIGSTLLFVGVLFVLCGLFLLVLALFGIMPQMQ